MQIVSCGALAVGIVLAVLAVLVSFTHRRADVSLRDAFWAGSDLGSRPERYVRDDYVATVRALNLVGIVFFVLGVVMLVVESLWQLV